MPPDDLFDDGKADADARGFPALGLVEPLKDQGQVPVLHAAAVVRDGAADLLDRLLEGDVNLPCGRCVLAGVFQKIGDGLGHPGLVAVQVGGAGDPEVLLRVHGLQGCPAGLHKEPQILWSELEGIAVGAEPLQPQQGADQSLQLVQQLHFLLQVVPIVHLHKESQRAQGRF